jgi:hypothetical protein
MQLLLHININLNFSNMKHAVFFRYPFSFLLLTIIIIFNAVNSYGQTSIGIKASVNRSKMLIKDADGDITKNKLTPLKYDLGVFADLPINETFFIRPELLYVTKGLNEVRIFNQSMGTTMNLSYAELPIYFLYKGKLSGGNLLLGLGPYIAHGIHGKDIYGGSESDIKFRNELVYDGRQSIRPWDAGSKFMAGYEWKNGLSFALNASVGMTNILPDYNGDEPDNSLKNRVFGFSVGYLILSKDKYD